MIKRTCEQCKDYEKCKDELVDKTICKYFKPVKVSQKNKTNVLLKTDIKREAGKLYYCKTSDDGCLLVCEAELKRGR